MRGMKDARPVAVIAALEQEAGTLVRRMPRSDTVGPRISSWESGGLVVLVAGVGKVATAICSQYACDVFRPRCVIAIGLAHGLENDFRPGQLIVATGAVQHDVDGRSMVSADPALSEKLLRAARLESRHARSGLVLTGDQIVTSSSVRDALLRDYPDAACLDSETGAVAQAALQNGVPWSALRVLSDSADATFDLRGALGLGVSTAADLFENVIQSVVDEL